jgi:hypothetical protein
MVQTRGGQVEPLSEAILSAPPLDTRYVERNPVKYLVNQVLHLPDVIAAAEQAALS